MRDVAYDLVGKAAAVTYGDLPEDIVQTTKKFILDTLGCGIAGSTAGASGTVDLFKDWAGKKEATVMVFGGRLPAPNAAYLNSLMIQSLDLDDIHQEGVLHANVAVLPAALALAERRGDASGKDLITAVATGVDIACRVAMGIVGILKFFPTAVGGYFGGATAAAKMLGLDENLLHNTIGLAYCRLAATGQSIVERTLSKRHQNAAAAEVGVLSALLAQRGVTGPKNVFEGQWGLFPLFFGGTYNRDKMLRDLGSFEGKNLGVKLYVGGYYTHPCNDATLSLVQKHNIKPEDVVEVTAHVPETAYIMVGRPFEIGPSPQVDAQFSIPYGIALAIARRHVFIGDFAEDKIRSDTEVLKLAAKVKVVGDQGTVAAIGRAVVPVIIEIKTRDNNLYSERVDVINGSPGKPASMERVAEKFRDCCGFSARPMSKARIEEIIRVVYSLEALPNVRSLARLLA